MNHENPHRRPCWRAVTYSIMFSGIPPVQDLGNIPHRLTKTLRALNSQPGDPHFGELFLLHQLRNPELLIFSSDEALGFLRNSKHVVCDGNFKYNPHRPHPFAQIYTVHGFVNGECFPLVYALLPDKTAASYTRLFTVIRTEILQRHPDIGRINGGVWHFDFEDPTLTAFEAVFPEAEAKGCVFHFGQALVRKRGNLGIIPAYNQVPAVVQWFRRLQSLCLLPEYLVLPVANDLLGNPPLTGNGQWDNAIQEFCNYFRLQWLRPGYIRVWNHLSNDDGPRTTNHAEGWHNSLHLKFPHQHPDLGLFIHKAQQWFNADCIRMRNLAADPVNHPPNPRRPVDIANDAAITQAKANFLLYVNAIPVGQMIDRNRVLQYLDHIEHHLGNRN